MFVYVEEINFDFHSLRASRDASGGREKDASISMTKLIGQHDRRQEFMHKNSETALNNFDFISDSLLVSPTCFVFAFIQN